LLGEWTGRQVRGELREGESVDSLAAAFGSGDHEFIGGGAGGRENDNLGTLAVLGEELGRVFEQFRAGAGMQ
jgi:hypothetical protein